MSLFLIGINHRSAPLSLREQVAVGPQQMPAALRELLALEPVDEALILSTCNRTELTVAGRAEAPAAVTQWLARHRGLDAETQSCLYSLEEDAAVRQLFLVACGLDSMIIGEPQILGQLKDAYRIAHAEGAVGPILNRLCQRAFGVAKVVRSGTGIGASPVSMAYAATSLARRIFAGFNRHSALLVGAGATIELTARHLHGQGLRKMIVANRSVSRARDLARQFAAFAISLDEIPAHLAEADIVISATSSPTFLIGVRDIETALRERRNRPMFLVDLAVPRDIDPAVSEVEEIYLYTVDDLANFTERSRALREQAAERAGDIVEAELIHFAKELRTLNAVPVIRELRNHAGAVRSEALAQAQKMLSAGRDPEAVLDALARTLTNKLLHGPSVRLRQAGEDSDEDLLRAARELFGLKE